MDKAKVIAEWTPRLEACNGDMSALRIQCADIDWQNADAQSLAEMGERLSMAGLRLRGAQQVLGVARGD